MTTTLHIEVALIAHRERVEAALRAASLPRPSRDRRRLLPRLTRRPALRYA